jgi:hypothetical protein
VSLPVSFGQMTLALDWDLHTGDAASRRAEAVKDRHGVFPAGTENPLSSRCGVHGPVQKYPTDPEIRGEKVCPRIRTHKSVP